MDYGSYGCWKILVAFLLRDVQRFELSKPSTAYPTFTAPDAVAMVILVAWSEKQFWVTTRVRRYCWWFIPKPITTWNVVKTQLPVNQRCLRIFIWSLVKPKVPRPIWEANGGVRGARKVLTLGKWDQRHQLESKLKEKLPGNNNNFPNRIT